jgi:hypothetical protein
MFIQGDKETEYRNPWSGRMRLIQERPGWNWYTDDPAKLHIKDSGSSIETPKTLKCYVMHDSVNCGESIEVEFENLEFLASAIFGLGRPSSPGSNTKWTGDAYKHGIYRCMRPFSAHPVIVIIEAHGGGTQGYYWNTLTAYETWTHLANILPTEALWSVCHDLCQMYHNARSVERRKIHREFLEGRLRKRRRNRTAHIEVLPKP